MFYNEFDVFAAIRGGAQEIARQWNLRLAFLRAQHSVGHGGFLTGKIATPGAEFNYAFDCGSQQVKRLWQVVKDFSEAVSKLDVLFISHLDSDHVAGIDALLKKTSVDMVVLPYIDADALLFQALADEAAGALSRQFVDLAQNDAEWFRSRGVKTVIRILPAGGTDSAPVPPPPGGEPRESEERETLSALWTGKREGARQPFEIDTATSPPIASNLPSNAVMSVRSGQSAIDWVFVPFVQPADKTHMKRFRSGLNKIARRRLGSQDYLRILADDAQRKALKDCYRVFGSSHNRVSLCLYDGPYRASRNELLWFDKWHRLYWPRGAMLLRADWRQPGWISTGDAELKVKKCREAFLAHYDRLIPHTGTMVLPHHGSARNFDKKLLAGLPTVKFFVAAAGKKTDSHPHNDVINAIRLARRAFVHVGDVPGEAFVQAGGFR